MIEKGLVSIIMPTYNCGKFIGESIESIQKQTYTDWELLLQDDCSVDDTSSIVKQYIEHDSRIRYEINKYNCGAALTRNAALQRAKGKWIAFLDSDDLWMPDKLEKQIAFMCDNNYDFSYTNCEDIDENCNSLGIIETGPKHIGKFKMYLYNFIGCCTVMYNREKIGLVQIADLKKRNDYAIWLKVIEKADCYLLDISLSKYRVRTSGNITTRGGIKRIKLLKWHYDLFTQGEQINPLFATGLTFVNIIFYLWRRVFYFKKKIEK